MIALQSGQAEPAVKAFGQLTAIAPANPLYCDRLAGLLSRLGRADEALAHYRQFLQANPRQLASRFNYASLLRRHGHLEEALRAYEHCIEEGIERPEEALTNMAVILADLNRQDEAAAALRRAIDINGDYFPARYNLALQLEESGDWPGARQQLQRIPAGDPLYHQALARQAHGETIGDSQHPLIARIEQALADPGCSDERREELEFALAKACDDCGRYEQAFEHCDRANSLALGRVPAYAPAAREALVGQLMAQDSAGAWAGIEAVSAAPLVFLCGMFRSGSTLLEQMLAAHPALVAGGEISFFASHLPPGELAGGLPAARAGELGRAYLQQLSARFGEGQRVIDKRLDNGYYIGLLRRLFPQAVFLRSTRHPLDTALSIYFQQLAAGFAYANRLEDIGHYWLQQQRLMDYWQRRYPGLVVDVAYEDIVRSPGETLEPVLQGLGLDWSDECLAFHRQQSRVRTASVAQVRKPLYSGSVGRWKNYRQQLQPLREQLLAAGNPGNYELGD
ncbi:sulfotransferase family protein [Seongchinamella sediminis]|uniref:Sulfotransferase family protein n=2 Tax=Seongchinamella sediminis TaxID=2283635 RepID=A0A3L7DZR3_9GAMM|nr:sulfotransferase family protein [Seongchinamella sediminis]